MALTMGHDPLSFLIQKAGHFTEYLILALLIYRALRWTFARWPGRHVFLATLLACALWAASDEWHQSFVPQRTPHLRDVFIDTAGALTALALVWWFGYRRQQAGQAGGAAQAPQQAGAPHPAH
ncbi:MAG: VanZ family protein [Symbiobacteriia bacterium]